MQEEKLSDYSFLDEDQYQKEEEDVQSKEKEEGLITNIRAVKALS